MYSNDFRELVKRKYNDQGSYRAVARILDISPETVRRIVLDLCKRPKDRPGPKYKVTDKQIVKIKREIGNIADRGERVTSRKVQMAAKLDHVTDRTVRRVLSGLGFSYFQAKKDIVLSPNHRKARIAYAQQWIADSHQWAKVIFTDEKRFSCDGPDSWATWAKERPTRNKRQQGGPSVQIWGMLVPGNTLYVFTLDQRSNAKDYIEFLHCCVLPLITGYSTNDLIFQQDNASIHNSAQTQSYLRESGLNLMKWPSKSPDLNIIENVWHLLSSLVYDGPQFLSKEDLWLRIQTCADKINADHQVTLQTLRDSMPRRLLSLIANKGAMTEY